ncbi:DUF4253 domain-containing protein [Actinophytocola glycyrrhizae]|uniref:DUF4253 domain-containing protein n=1 Tax=Actinophytocola glycyrrhizae TaxID=2044873 RepID=A0ABV9S403_9PSEU
MITLDGLSVALPPGRIVRAKEGDGRPAFWLSDGPLPPRMWATLRADHPRSGLWPLLLTALDPHDEFRPWGDGDVDPDAMTSPASHDVDAVLAHWWAGQQPVDGSESDVIAPYGTSWPGRSPRLEPSTDPDATAAELVEVLASFDDDTRFGLVPAERGADAITSAGWLGPVNHTGDTAKLSAVLRDWEDRFGARLIGAGFATLQVSVAAPPGSREEALSVAAEHFAFCPDNVWQGPEGTLAGYAERLVGEDTWYFWWD